jgi:hypothetical protein
MGHLVKCFPLTVLELFLGLLRQQAQPRQHLLNFLLLRGVVGAVVIPGAVVLEGLKLHLLYLFLLEPLTP